MPTKLEAKIEAGTFSKDFIRQIGTELAEVLLDEGTRSKKNVREALAKRASSSGRTMYDLGYLMALVDVMDAYVEIQRGGRALPAPKSIHDGILGCMHANECPNICPCPSNCYCKSNTCQGP